MSIEISGAPWWGKRFAKRRAPCAGTEGADARCLTTSMSLGQDMYTPRPGHEPGVVPDWRNERPYAAWLYAGAEARVASERSLRTVGLALGVIGPPAFGEFAQRTAHKLSGVYSREPVGWNTQVGFEPGVVLTARSTHRFAAQTSSGNVVADFGPHVGAWVGNVLTEGETGFQAQLTQPVQPVVDQRLAVAAGSRALRERWRARRSHRAQHHARREYVRRRSSRRSRPARRRILPGRWRALPWAGGGVARHHPRPRVRYRAVGSCLQHALHELRGPGARRPLV